jgi:hypothetical protein
VAGLKLFLKKRIFLIQADLGPFIGINLQHRQAKPVRLARTNIITVTAGLQIIIGFSLENAIKPV